MQSMTMVPIGLMVAGLVLIGLAVKAMAELTLTTRSVLYQLVAWPGALLVLLLGLVTAGTFLNAVFPESWGKAAYWGVLAALSGLTGLFAAMWVGRKTRRAAAPMPDAAPVMPLLPVMPEAPAATAATAAPGTRTTWPRPGLEAGLAAIRAHRVARAKYASRFFLVLAVPLAGIFAVLFGWGGAVAVVLALLIVVSQCHALIGNVSEAEYRSLPGSKDESGRHRCVYCGRWGIYRRGAYASNSTWSDCSSCRKHLFVD